MILSPTFPNRRPRAAIGLAPIEYQRTGRAAKRRRQLARKRERERVESPRCVTVAELADLFVDAARLLATSISIPAGAGRVLDMAVERVRVDFAALWCLDPATQALRLVAVSHPDAALAPFAAACRRIRFAAGVGLPGRVLATGVATCIPDLMTDANFPRVNAARNVGLNTGIGIPIRRFGRVIGTIELYRLQSPPADEPMLRLLTGLGDILGLFLDESVFGCFGNNA